MGKVFIIAEAGVNHNGSLHIAKKMVDTAVKAGCDAVKFQTFKAENIVTKNTPKARYQARNSAAGESQFAMLKKLELSEEDHIRLFNYCKKRGIEFMSTPFDESAVDFLDNLGIKRFKIASGEITNKPLIARAAKKGKPIILSTGMSYMAEVKRAVKWIKDEWRRSNKQPSLTVMHCVSDYPADPKDVNLSVLTTLKNELKSPVGLSDHTLGIEIAIAASAMGAVVIEKHFTLDREMRGPDHKASLEPGELESMVRSIRTVERSMGDGIKRPVKKEIGIRKLVRKNLVAAVDIRAGEKIYPGYIALKRSGYGIPAEDIEKILGSVSRSGIKKDSVLKMSQFTGKKK